MAKSFYSILSEGTLEVNHKGEDVTFNLPAWLIAAAEKLENEEKLLEWAQEYEVVHGLLHFGIQQLIIALRAAARPKIKIFKEADKAKAFLAAIENQDEWHINVSKDEFSKLISVDANDAQKRIDNFELKPVPKPGESKAVAEKKAETTVLIKTIVAMRTAGQDDNVIKVILDPAFGAEKVTLAMKEIDNKED